MLSLVACNTASQNVDDLPDEIGADKVNQSDNNSKINAYLRFYMPEKVSSIFSSIDVTDFDISDVKYTIVYTDGTTTTEVNGGAVTLSMVDEADRELLEKAGHHQIHVSTTLSNGKSVSGSFALHLKDHYTETPQVKVTMILGESNAQAYFGNVSNGKAIVNVDKGIKFDSWDDFTDAFSVACEGKALDFVTVNGTKVDFSKGYTISQDTEFTAHWTDNVIVAKFNLNIPADATVVSGKQSAVIVNDEGVDISNQSVVRNLGKIQQPIVDKFNVFNGYYFSGWYKDVNNNGKYDSDDIFWNFSQRVGKENINLVARWTDRAYSFTLYTMGGSYPAGVSNSVVNGTSITSDDVATSLGYRVLESASRFSLDDGSLNRIVISGLVYGEQYSKCVVKVKVSASSDEIVYFTFEDMLANLVKGSKSYVVYDGVYRDYQCTQEANVTEVKADSDGYVDDIGYIKWVFNEPEKPAAGASDTEIAQYKRLRLERMSNYYLEVVFKNSLTKKPDGSLRIDRIDDESISGLIIPATLLVDGVECAITEISAKSCMNLKALLTLDLSEATNLVTIGEQAFAHCPALSTVVFPTDSKIEEVGANIFYRSTFENEYHKNTNSDFIVINNILYKYVGEENEHTTVDLSSLDGVTIIASGAFENRTDVQEVDLGNNIQSIQNGAFKGCSNLENVKVNANESSLKYIGETAFDGCDKLISAENENVYIDKYKAIIIGRVYYRMLDKSAKTAVIPTNVSNDVYVNYIAPKAFDGCTAVEDIQILYEEQILDIGKDAFTSTTWITKNKDNYTIINGMIAVYYTKSENAKADIKLPTGSDYTIKERAFGSFANQISTIEFHKNIVKIEDYAFSGANALVSLIFPEVSLNNGKLVGAPLIDDYAFAGTDGELLDYVKFYFKEDVIEFLKENKSNSSNDAVTATWLQLYSQYTDRFIAEDIHAVWIDSSVVSNIILKTNANESLLQTLVNTYGATIDGALRIRDNSEVERGEALVLQGDNNHNVQFVPIQEGSVYYKEGVNRYLVTFEYNHSSKGCQNSEDSETPFILTVVDAISGNPTNAEVIKVDGNNKNNSNYWIEGFEGQVDGATMPTFYTSNPGVEVKFGYKDINGNVRYIQLDSKNISGVSFKVETTVPSTAVFTVDFYGVCTYKFSVDYMVKTSKYVKIEQTNAVSIPINGNATKYFKEFAVNLVGQDGNFVTKDLTTANFTVIKVDGIEGAKTNTSDLGLHTITIQYSKTDAVGTLEYDIVYAVVLEADEGLFSYSVNEFFNTATITACSASRDIETIVLPSTYTDPNTNVTYPVVGIGINTDKSTGVFEGYRNLKAVYLGANIQMIGARTFENCTSLENVHTVQVLNINNANLTTVNFETVKEDVVSETEKIVYVNVKNLDGVTADNGRIAIGAEYTVLSGESNANKTIYRVVGIKNVTAPSDTTQVFLPDSIYTFGQITVDGGSALQPNVYSATNNIKFTTLSCVNSALESIGVSAFENCTSLKTIDLSLATDLKYINSRAFYNTGLTSIDLSANTLVAGIDAQTFEDCANLETVTISSNVKVIATSAFKNCTSLSGITFSDNNGLTTIATDAFDGCNKEGFIAPNVA